MAGLGTVFVELSLDDKPYKQRLSETLKSTEATAKGIETSWKALGVKSSEYFDAQRRAAKNAYTLIKNHATSTANDIMRAEQAKNAQLKALNDKQFGTQKSGITSLKDHWIAATIAITAAWMTASRAISKVSDIAMAGARYETLGVAMNVVGKNSGYMTSEMEEAAVKMQKMGISMTESRNAIIQLITAGLKLTDAEKFASVARDAAVVGMTNTTDAMMKIIQAVKSGEVTILKSRGR